MWYQWIVGVYKTVFTAIRPILLVWGGFHWSGESCESDEGMCFQRIEAAVPGNRIGDISYSCSAICREISRLRSSAGAGWSRSGKKFAWRTGCSGISGTRGNGPKLQEGLVIAIEPMINREQNVVQENDGWTIRTKTERSLVTMNIPIAITKGAADILSSFTPDWNRSVEQQELISREKKQLINV